jgi:hypothetical protein
MKFCHDTQGVSKLDLIWVLHGIIGQVLAWEDDERKGYVLGDGEFPTDGRGFDPTDLH